MTCPFCDIEHTTTVPTVHLNGTSPENLREDLTAALDAFREAQRLMVVAAPNGRDYYPQGDRAMHRAMNSHERRCADLNCIMVELEEMRDHVQAVIDHKEAARARR